ncbi:hypothetical protein AKJ16_DCAP06088, partial [Drosera capensis]
LLLPSLRSFFPSSFLSSLLLPLFSFKHHRATAPCFGHNRCRISLGRHHTQVAVLSSCAASVVLTQPRLGFSFSQSGSA